MDARRMLLVQEGERDAIRFRGAARARPGSEVALLAHVTAHVTAHVITRAIAEASRAPSRAASRDPSRALSRTSVSDRGVEKRSGSAATEISWPEVPASYDFCFCARRFCSTPPVSSPIRPVLWAIFAPQRDRPRGLKAPLSPEKSSSPAGPARRRRRTLPIPKGPPPTKASLSAARA